MSLRTRFFLLVALGSIVTATAAYVLHFRFLDNLERQTIDLRFSLRGDQEPPKDVVIVKVDDVTFNEHKRMALAVHRGRCTRRLLDHIRKGNPKAVAFDIQFSELGSAAGDNALGYAFIRNRGQHRRWRPPRSTTKGRPNLFFDERRCSSSARARETRTFRPTRTASSAASGHTIERLKSFRVVAAEIAHRPDDHTRRDGQRRAVDRLRRLARNHHVVLLLPRPRRARCRRAAFKDKVVVIGRDRPVPPGHPRHADGRRHVRAGDPGERDRRRRCAAFRCAACRRAGTSCSSSSSGCSSRWSASVPARWSQSPSASSATALLARHAARVRAGRPRVVLRLPDGRPRDGDRRLGRRPLHARGLRARARARRLLALRARSRSSTRCWRRQTPTSACTARSW